MRLLGYKVIPTEDSATPQCPGSEAIALVNPMDFPADSPPRARHDVVRHGAALNVCTVLLHVDAAAGPAHPNL